MDSGNTAWLLTSAALVLLMTPGLAFFYSGLVRTKSAAATIMQSFVMAGVATVVWMHVGLLTGLRHGHRRVHRQSDQSSVCADSKPTADGLAFMVFQMMFAIITPALITGAFVERESRSRRCWSSRFSGSLFVYAPICHWVWARATAGCSSSTQLDFAGGTVVHINAGAAALAGALVRWPTPRFGRGDSTARRIQGRDWRRDCSGSAGSDSTPVQRLPPTSRGRSMRSCRPRSPLPAAYSPGHFLSWRYTGHPSIIGAATGAVAGLVAITPAAGFGGTVAGNRWLPQLLPGTLHRSGGLDSRLLRRARCCTTGVTWMTRSMSLPSMASCGMWGALAIGIFAVAEVTGGANGFDRRQRRFDLASARRRARRVGLVVGPVGSVLFIVGPEAHAAPSRR